MADRAGEQAQKRSLAIAMAAALDEPVVEAGDYAQWYDLFAIFDRLRPVDEKFILIIDEYQYLCQVQPAFSSFIQKWWDEHWQQQNVMVILCGSVTSMMFRETLAQSSPLYGRASQQILLAPLGYEYIQEFLPDRSEEELVQAYSLAGGVPRYLELLAKFPTYADALRELVLEPTGILYHEARHILNEEISSPNTCWSILHALGGGTGRISQIGHLLSLPANQLTHYMELLRQLFLIVREVPVLEKNPEKSKKGFYQIADPFLRLWFGSIYSYDSFLEFGQTEMVQDRLAPLIQTHIAYCYETICQDFVKKYNGLFGCLRLGRQWAGGYEIDVAGVDSDLRLNVVGECKWSSKKVGISVLKELRGKVADNKLPLAANCRYVLFSRAGFTPDLVTMAEEEDRIILVRSLFSPI